MRLIVFDLDGTLVDSLPDLTSALNRTLAAGGLAPFTEAQVAPMVGDGAGMLLRRACARRGITADDAMVAAYIADYTAHSAQETRAYPGIPEVLARLRGQGYRLAVCTNKPERPARAVLAAIGLAGFFDAVLGGDSCATRKPDPGHLLATIRAAGGVPQASLMVGDHRNDVLAAWGAGTKCIFAAWGYGTPDMEGDAVTAPDAAAIPDLAGRLLPA
jgi:phosphoglycolate phosphatase